MSSPHSPKIRLIIAVAIAAFPMPIKRFLMRKLLGYTVSDTAVIGVSVVAPIQATIGENAFIGHLTTVKGLQHLVLEDAARIGNLNWITGNGLSPLRRHDGTGPGVPKLIMGKHSALTNRHYVDCSDTVTIGEYSTIAGVRSQIFTHFISIESNQQGTAMVDIGNYCFVGTGVTLLPGSGLPNFSVLGAGSVLNKRHSGEYGLYAGAPAEYKSALNHQSKYFHRESGFVY